MLSTELFAFLFIIIICFFSFYHNLVGFFLFLKFLSLSTNYYCYCCYPDGSTQCIAADNGQFICMAKFSPMCTQNIYMTPKWDSWLTQRWSPKTIHWMNAHQEMKYKHYPERKYKHPKWTSTQFLVSCNRGKGTFPMGKPLEWIP